MDHQDKALTAFAQRFQKPLPVAIIAIDLPVGRQVGLRSLPCAVT